MAKLKTFIILLVLAAGVQANAQVYRFKTTGFSVLEKNEKGKWGEWSDLQKAEMIITLDTNKNRIIVYSQEIQLYNIVTYEKEQENDDDLIYPFVCTDEDGQQFTISIITRKKQGNRKQMYINQKNVILMYNIENYKDK